MAKNISFTVKYWKQNGPKDAGHFEQREMKNIPDDTSFLEMLDILNEELINDGKEPFVFDHDCREGICGMCSLYINGTPHGKTAQGATTCQLYMRRFNDGDVITVEPWLNLYKLRGVNPDFRLSVGTEVEISHNFAVSEKTIVNPTLALKWNF